MANRSKSQRTFLLAAIMILGTSGAAGQTRPLLDPSVAPKPPAPLGATNPVVRDGLFTIDVVVTDSAEHPVSELAPLDFTLLDNGRPAKIRTLHNSLAASEPAPELIFVLDGVNLSLQKLAQAEGAIVHFLRRNDGHLEAKCFLYRLTRDGLFSSPELTQDGNLLAKEVEQHNSPRTVWRSGRNSQPHPLGPWDIKPQPISLSLSALGSIAIDQREIRRRKVVVWIGPGWAVNGGEIDFDEATELSTRLREARITLDNVNVWPKPNSSLNDQAPRSQKDMKPAQMALQMIATRTGGLVLDSPGELDREIERCVEQERNFYTVTFNPPHTFQMDEYHDLRVQVPRPALRVRAPTGYYNEPVYFDNPPPGIEKVTVAQLEEMVHSGIDLPRKLAGLELTERLSTARLDALLELIHGEREREALTADADLSIALAPPPDDIMNRPPPSAEEQSAVLRRTFDYLQSAIPKLPDFYAVRNTVRYEEPAERDTDNWKMPHQEQTLHSANSEHATVHYRNGEEMVEKDAKIVKSHVAGAGARTLDINGTFGPILSFVLTAAATRPSTLIWKRWEHRTDGDLAVFSYRIASTDISPELMYCCLPEGDGTTFYHNRADTYGEFAVNADTGAIMRIVINADLDEERDPDVPLVRSQIMVEYGPVNLGGKIYVCPKRSVEVSRGRSRRELQEWGMAFRLYSYFETMINDVTFEGYHKFGSESRILPGFEENAETETPRVPQTPVAPAQQPPIEQPDGRRQVTVGQLMEIVGNASDKAADEIEHLQLTERLSNSKLAMLSAKLTRRKSKAALIVVGDESVFLTPPSDEIPQKPAPDLVEQNRIMSLAMDYLRKIIPKLPDFYAKRYTTSFLETPTSENKKGMHRSGGLHRGGKFVATVYYRGGKEVVRAKGAEQRGLVTVGTFGPILRTAILDAAHSATMQWGRWEDGPNGLLAVFRFDVPEADSHYSISGGGESGMVGPTAYHGEIGIDPESGTILRLVLEAVPPLGSLTQRADVMVEYGPVEIGGKTYTCPVRSVSYSVNTLFVPSAPGFWNKGEAVRLNDVVFSDYHVFRTEMRIVP